MSAMNRLSARLSHRNSVCPSVRHTGGSLPTSFLEVSTSMTLNDLEPPNFGVLVNFSRFRVTTHISRVNCAVIARDYLQMKFSALNVDFSS